MNASSTGWMRGDFNGKLYYMPQEWMKCDWNGDFFYELSKLGEIGCVKFCMDLGLVSSSYECPACGEEMKLVKIEKLYWCCRKKGKNPHSIKRSLKKGTWFNHSSMSFGLVLRMTYMWINKISKESLMNDLGVASQTATEWRNYCREVCMDHCLRFDGQVGGDELMVDIYEAWLNKEAKPRIERKLKGHSAFVGVVRHLNDCFVEVVEDRSAEVLVEVIIKRIRPGSVIVVNCGTLYSSFQQIFDQLEVSHNVIIKDSHNTMDGMWSTVKKALQGTDSKDGEFNGELAEHIWRKQNNLVITQQVHNFLKTISASYPPKTKD